MRTSWLSTRSVSIDLTCVMDPGGNGLIGFARCTIGTVASMRIRLVSVRAGGLRVRFCSACARVESFGRATSPA
jgi:hypothetical protein